MANPWDNDPVIPLAGQASARQAMPWDSDPIVTPAPQGEYGFAPAAAPPGQAALAAPAMVHTSNGQQVSADRLPAFLADTPGVKALDAPAVTPPPPKDTFSRRLGLGVRDAVEGVAGVPYNVAAAGLRAAGIPAQYLGENLTSLGLPQAETPGEQLTSAIAQPIAGTLTGQGIGRVMQGAASPIAQGVGQVLASQPGTQAAAAAVGGAVGHETGNPWLGLAASLVTPFAGAAAGRAISPNILGNISPERAALLATAQQEGIPLTLAQQTGGKVARNFESTLGNLPGSSGQQAAVNDVQQSAFNRAVLARSGTDADTATPDVLNQARARIGQVFQTLSGRNQVTPDPQLATELQALATNVQRNVPESMQGPIQARIEDAINGFATGTMPGTAYQQLDSAIGKQIAGTTDGFLRTNLGTLRDTLRGAMDRSITPQDQAAWQEARRQYGVLMQTARAMNRPTEGTVMGDISPAALAQATNNPATRSFAFGRGQLDDLARLGQGAMKQTVPDSGTAQRTMMANLLTGGNLTGVAAGVGGALAGGVNPLYALAVPAISVGLPRAAGAVYHSNVLGRYLTNDLAAGLTPQPNRLSSLVIGGEQQADRLRDR